MPVLPHLRTPSPVLAAPSTATGRMVTLVLRKEGISAAFVMKKIHVTLFTQELLTSKRQFCSQVCFETPEPGSHINPHARDFGWPTRNERSGIWGNQRLEGLAVKPWCKGCCQEVRNAAKLSATAFFYTDVLKLKQTFLSTVRKFCCIFIYHFEGCCTKSLL